MYLPNLHLSTGIPTPAARGMILIKSPVFDGMYKIFPPFL